MSQRYVICEPFLSFSIVKVKHAFNSKCSNRLSAARLKLLLEKEAMYERMVVEKQSLQITSDNPKAVAALTRFSSAELPRLRPTPRAAKSQATPKQQDSGTKAGPKAAHRK